MMSLFVVLFDIGQGEWEGAVSRSIREPEDLPVNTCRISSVVRKGEVSSVDKKRGIPRPKGFGDFFMP